MTEVGETIVKEKFQTSLSRIYKYDHVNNGRKENAIGVILDLIAYENAVNIILSIRKLIYLVSISVKMVDTGGVESGGSSNNTMNFVTFGKEKLSQVRTILTGNTSNQCTFNLPRRIWCVTNESKIVIRRINRNVFIS